jgi:tRNA-binding EMAP/Myf-like protein
MDAPAIQPQFSEYISRMLSFVGDEDPMAILASTPSKVAALVAATPRAAQQTPPGPGRWSMAQVVAHLADSEIVAGYRLRMILTVNGTPLQAFDQDRWADTFHYERWDARESARHFAAARAGTLRMLRSISPDLMDNYGMHPERGRETIRHLLRLYAGHDRNHLAQVERCAAASGAVTLTPAPQRPEVPLDALASIDLRVGTIVEVSEVTGADRLMRLRVSFGAGEVRTVLAGIKAERPDAQALVGRQALFYYNVQRRTIRGEESQAMICDVGHADGLLPALLEPECPMPDGARAG